MCIKQAAVQLKLISCSMPMSMTLNTDAVASFHNKMIYDYQNRFLFCYTT